MQNIDAVVEQANRRLGLKWCFLRDQFGAYCRYGQDTSIGSSSQQRNLAMRLDGIATMLDVIRCEDPAAFFDLFANFAHNPDLSFRSDQYKLVLKGELDSSAQSGSYSSSSPPSELELERQLCHLLLHLPIPDASSSDASQQQHGSKQAHTGSQRQLSQLQEHFARQFGRPFRGDAAFRFLRFVLKVGIRFDGTASRRLYFWGSAVVQSSGTGKTRMVLELAKYAPLLFVCLRPKYGTILDEFPPSDEPVVSYFLKDADSFRPDQDDKGANGDKPAFYFTYDLQVAAFLGAWFEVLAADLQTCTDASSKHELLLDLNRFGSGPGSQSAGINSNILQRRDAFFGRVCQAAQTKVTEVATHPDTTAYHTDTFASCLTEGIRALATELRQVRDYLWSLDSNQHVRQQIDDMLAGEWTKPEFDKPPIFVAADDCVQLIEQTSGTSGGDHRLNSLRRA